MARKPDFIDAWSTELPCRIKTSVILTLFLLFSGIGAAGAWALMVPVGGAVLAYGSAIAEGRNVTVKHLEGGIVSEIPVKEGDVIDRGQTLVRLDTTASQAKLNQYLLRLYKSRVHLNRYAAERAQQDRIRFDDDLVALSTENLFIKKLMAVQVKEFDANRNTFLNEIEAITRKIETLEIEIDGYRKLLKAHDEQLRLLDDEIGVQVALLERGLTKRSLVLSLQRQKAKTQGDLDAIAADRDANTSRVAELRVEMAKLRADRLREINDEMIKEISNADEAREIVTSLRDTVTRSVIVSPVEGKIVKVNINSKSAIIKPAEPIFEILPKNTPLTAEVRIAPDDIDQIRPGQEARVYFPGVQDINNGYIDGKVTYISPDTVYDEAQKVSYYPVRIDITSSGSPFLHLVYPGMMAEAHMSVTPQTFARLIVDPIIRSANRAFTE